MNLDKRGAGLLLHITSLPGPHGSGDLGPSAHRFVETLARAGCRWWQTLPVTPTGHGFSPYSGSSAFAGNPSLISLAALQADGLLLGTELRELPSGPAIDMETNAAYRADRLRVATGRFVEKGGARDEEFLAFADRERGWLDDFALFMALGQRYGFHWPAWPEGLRAHDSEALRRARVEVADALLQVQIEQFFFDRQWSALKASAREQGVGLIGDAPIFVSHESADVWANQSMFRLDAEGAPTHVAGVPPDYFSETGQRWGNPLYRWKECERSGFAWWIARFRRLASLFDIVRLDHFIGFVRYWAIPAAEATAVNGRYLKAPGAKLFEAAQAALGGLPFIAEDLGSVTSSVKRLRRNMRVPGMRVLQFAFGTDVQAKAFLPHAYPKRTVAYTGTHDNDTLVGWLTDKGGGPRSAAQAEKERSAAVRYFGGKSDDAAADVAWAMIRGLYASVAATVIVPVQDVLALDNGSRMNIPGTANGNWSWRLRDTDLTPAVVERLRALAETYERT